MKPDPTPLSGPPAPAVPATLSPLAQTTEEARPQCGLPIAEREGQDKLRKTEDTLRFLVRSRYAPSGEDFFQADEPP